MNYRIGEFPVTSETILRIGKMIRFITTNKSHTYYSFRPKCTIRRFPPSECCRWHGFHISHRLAWLLPIMRILEMLESRRLGQFCSPRFQSGERVLISALRSLGSTHIQNVRWNPAKPATGASAQGTKFVTLLTDSFSPYPPFRWSGGRLLSSKALCSYGYAFPPSDRDPRFPQQRSTRPLASSQRRDCIRSLLRSDKK